MNPRRSPLLLGLVLAAACASPTSEELDDDVGAVTVDTSRPQARAQYDANIAFVDAYRATCKKTDDSRRRVLVTGYGRFPGVERNRSGELAAQMLPEKVVYRDVPAPQPGEVDPPERHTSVGQGSVHLARTGDVEVCAMVLPVYWDVAAVLVAKEVASFEPDFVVMHGGPSSGTDYSIELGAVNVGSPWEDATGLITSVPEQGVDPPLIADAPSDETRNGSLLSWRVARQAAAEELDRLRRSDGTGRLDPLRVRLRSFPRDSNTYLCNNVTYVTDYVMRHPTTEITLLQASQAVSGRLNEVRFRLGKDLTKSPRVFIHVPPALDAREAADITKHIIDAQLQALGDPANQPTVGTNDLAEP